MKWRRGAKEECGGLLEGIGNEGEKVKMAKERKGRAWRTSWRNGNEGEREQERGTDGNGKNSEG